MAKKKKFPTWLIILIIAASIFIGLVVLLGVLGFIISIMRLSTFG